MGLDIAVYTELRRIATVDTYDEFYSTYNATTCVYIDAVGDEAQRMVAPFTHKTVLKSDGIQERIRFGSYGSYGRWLTDLQRIIPITPEDPMYALVTASNPDVQIGTHLVRALLRSFLAHQSAVQESHPAGSFFVGGYNKWLYLLDLAQHGGIIQFE